MKTAQDTRHQLATGPVNGCGLASLSLALQQELAPRLRAEEGDSIIFDAVRACNCGEVAIVYAYTMQKVNKLCLSCGAFESKISIVEVGNE